MIVAVEPGASFYFFNKTVPSGPSIGGRFDVPIKWGFGVAAGYQGTFVLSETAPMTTHHPYLSLVYRVDELPIIMPYAEIGGGVLFLIPTNRPLVQYVFAGHVGAGLDFKVSVFVVGFGLRYHAYLETQQFPGGLTAWIRLGFRFLEN